MTTIKGILVHNDAGRANGRGYRGWLVSDRVGAGKAERGFAHYYTDRRYNARYENTFNKAYHGGHSTPNNHYIGFEVNESLSATDAQFLQNEEVVMLQAAEDLMYYKLPINHTTVMLHRDFSSTTCPYRSWDLHVGRNAPNTAANRQKMRQYFIDRIKYWTKVLNGEIAIPGTVTPPTVPNDTPKAPDNSMGYKITPQTRRVGNWIANQRTAPSTAGKITFELEANFYFEVKGYVHGQSINGNDIWFVGAKSGQYVHSGETTNPSTDNLTHLVNDPHNKIQKSFTTVNTFTVGGNDLVIYDVPGNKGKRKGVAPKGSKVEFTTVYQVDGALWVGYENGRGEECFIQLADYNVETKKLTNLKGKIQDELKLA